MASVDSVLRWEAECRITPVVKIPGLPPAQGLYDPAHEHDACGVGFVVHVKGQRSHAIVEQAFKVLINLLHRGACGCEANTGDGAGILIQMPDRFFRRETPRLGFALPPERHYGAGFVFLPRDPALRRRDRSRFEDDRRRRRAARAGLARRADRRRVGRAERGRGRTLFPPAVHRDVATAFDGVRRQRAKRTCGSSASCT